MRLLVFHHDGLFADALSAVLSSEDVQVIGAESIADAVRESPAAEAVLIDMRADGALGAVQALSKRSPGLRVLACVEGNDPRQVVDVTKAGATGWISTSDGLDRLVHLLRKPVGAAGVTTTERAPMLAAIPAQDRHRLTARECEVLDGLTRGASTAALAAALHVSRATARTHVHNVLAKLGVHTRLEAVAYAIEHHLVRIEQFVYDDERNTPARVESNSS